MTTQTDQSLSLQVSRRQKRLSYWREQFLENHSSQADRLQDSERAQLEQSLQTYQLLLARLVQAHATKNTSDFQETEGRLAGQDRELTSLFESRRLLTSTVGSPAIISDVSDH